MITFHENDFNLIKIRKESKMFNLVTRRSYDIYGLKCGCGNPLIWIKGPRTIPLTPIRDFFAKNGLLCEITQPEYYGLHPVKIGLRRDLREHVILTACIVQTIIYAIERRISLKKPCSIPGIPKFPSAD